MKITRIKNSYCTGNALVLSMMLCGVLGLILISFLQLVQARTKIRARSLAWNSAIPVLEGGIEEAFTHLQDDKTFTANNWSAVSTNSKVIYQKSRTNSDNTYCFVTISNASTTSPTIYSQGYVPAPLGRGYISRLVQVITTNPIIFTKAIAAKGTVDLNGQTMVDSYDSSNTNYSTAGRYDPAKRRANGGVVTNSRGTPAVDVGNGHIYGQVDTGPGGTVNYTSGGTVGDLTWTTGIEPGWTNNDFNTSFLDQTAPPGAAGWLPLPLASVLGLLTTNTYVVNNTSYSCPGGLKMTGGQTMLVQGSCNLYIYGGDFSIGSGCGIYIAAGAKLNIYMDGVNTSVSGNGIVNQTGLASSYSYYGTTNNTAIKYTGGSDFVGTVNAPEADFIISGGANFYGAAIVNTYTSKSAGAAFHFDEDLGDPGQLKLVSYREL
jgi:hypothetical protein